MYMYHVLFVMNCEEKWNYQQLGMLVNNWKKGIETLFRLSSIQFYKKNRVMFSENCIDTYEFTKLQPNI